MQTIFKIILSRSKKDYKIVSINYLHSVLIKIKPKKKKMMAFQKPARKNADFHFLIDSQRSVQEYTY